MVVRVGISGLGRIGRAVLRAMFESQGETLELVAINGSTDEKTHAHLLQYDSVHGKFAAKIEPGDGYIAFDDKKIPLYRERSPENIPWENHGVDVVFECTGAFNSKHAAGKHRAGKVIVSAPVDDADITVVYGVNHHNLKKEHRIISAASCTTNCIVPVIDLLHRSIGVKNGFMTTVHSYTNDQNIVDGNHKDLRRARSCALSIIPTATGAAKSVALIIPELKGKIDGAAIRVPTPNVSIVDFAFTARSSTNVEEINRIMRDGSSDILSVCDEPLVSVDFNHTTYSAIVDLASTYVLDDNLCRVAAWYDNEWAFSVRMLDIAKIMS